MQYRSPFPPSSCYKCWTQKTYQKQLGLTIASIFRSCRCCSTKFLWNLFHGVSRGEKCMGCISHFLDDKKLLSVAAVLYDPWYDYFWMNNINIYFPGIKWVQEINRSGICFKATCLLLSYLFKMIFKAWKRVSWLHQSMWHRHNI